ncbi:Syntaxin-1A [Dactylella cylindrospora]|nr:Syntaxin-1A [Dactylella cylindrospora]
MAPLNGQPYQQSSNPQAFFGEIAYLRQGNQDINDRITEIENLHQESLSRIDESSIAEVASKLDAATAEVSQMNRTMAAKIRDLKSKTLSDPEKAGQVGVIERSFKQTLTRYQQVEVSYQRKARDQLARQYRIANPDATEDEIRDAQEANSSAPVFSQAVMQNRRGAARSALAEVRSRHTEIQKIEKTMIELAQLFEEMNQLVVEQEVIVDQIAEHGVNIHDDTKNANTQLAHAVDSARGARRKKWWCLLIAILVIIIVIIIVLVVVKPWAN